MNLKFNLVKNQHLLVNSSNIENEVTICQPFYFDMINYLMIMYPVSANLKNVQDGTVL